VPVLDRNVTSTGRSPVFSLVGGLAVAYMVGLTAWGYRSLEPIGVVLLTVALIVLITLVTRHRPGGKL
jgi:quinol-cytochrome oxidoreductase complex cytochrome b subunit